MTIIPIGTDCGAANILRDNGLRKNAYPFDWNLSYAGISQIIKNDFKDFIPTKPEELFHPQYKVKFFHDSFPELIEKYKRRIDRFRRILSSENEICFFKKGHSIHHHNECDMVKNDLTDVEEVCFLLKDRYPTLKSSFIIVLRCGACFNPNSIYTSQFSNVKIHNVASLQRPSDKKIEEWFLKSV